MTTLPQTKPAPRRPTARTPEGKLRQRVHALARQNGRDEAEYRERLEKIAYPYRYARLCDAETLQRVIDAWEASLVVPAYAADDYSDDAALAVLG